MHVRIIWALSFWSTSNFNGSLWGEHAILGNTCPAFHIKTCAPASGPSPRESIFNTSAASGTRSHNRSWLQMKNFLSRGLGIMLPDWQMIWKHKSETYSCMSSVLRHFHCHFNLECCLYICTLIQIIKSKHFLNEENTSTIGIYRITVHVRKVFHKKKKIWCLNAHICITLAFSILCLSLNNL